MGLKGAVNKVLIEKLILPFLDCFFSFEKEVLQWPQAIRSGPESSERFNIPEQALKRAQHGWIREYCDSCKVCVKLCPPKRS
jgi:hypothetical protein